MTVQQRVDNRASLSECLGRHVPATAPGAQRLEWLSVVPPLEHVRVLEHTCAHCAPIAWEFCQLGGAFLIRRTDYRSARHVVHQTAGVRYVQAWEWWQMLLYGHAV